MYLNIVLNYYNGVLRKNLSKVTFLKVDSVITLMNLYILSLLTYLGYILFYLIC